ncbi:mechanosensitive ion channel family protein [Halobacteriovorax sp. HLS]|uniref:mechanosensitive ion channel family protein n=1 Tax=Halobacteriovorax sp. HLS TaxID=2234000 RepID=UPI000FDC4AB2|nr:mechanosensitive ion channel family protein [Halobacteriovorax sp. HLS]
MTRLPIILLALFLSFSSVAGVYPKADFSSPRKTMLYFLKTMKGYKQGDQSGLRLATQALNLSSLDNASRVISGELAAKRLINTLDRIEYIDISKIPDNTNDLKIWIYKQERIVTAIGEKLLEISIAPNKDGQWKFTPITIDTIHEFEKTVANNEVAKGVIELKSWKSRLKSYFPAWTAERSFILLNGQWFALITLMFLGIVFEKIVRSIILIRITQFFSKRNIPFIEIKSKFLSAQGVFFFSGFWLFGLKFLELPDTILSTLMRLGIVSFTVASVFTTSQVVDVICQFLESKAKISENKFDDVLVPLIRKTAKFFVFAIGLIFIGDSLTLDMKNILAGLGIGGIAFALAAKDTISNLFGSLTVLIDRPFSIGDSVTIDGKIEGIVTEVGLRSTKIRTFYDSIISVPNGALINVHIDNLGKRNYRRYTTSIGLQYDTPAEKIEAFCEGIRQIILAHKWTRKDSFHVYFNNMGGSSLDILLYLFWQVPDRSAELQERHRLLIDILRLGKELEVDFAFPTQTLHIYNEEHAQKGPLDMPYLEKGKVAANEITSHPLSTKTHRSSADAESFKENEISL